MRFRGNVLPVLEADLIPHDATDIDAIAGLEACRMTNTGARRRLTGE